MSEKNYNKIVGEKGEEIACNYLKNLGWTILERNFRYSRISEIDIIAKDNDTIVFVEVKTRTSASFGHPFEAINKNKLLNIFKAGLSYLQKTKEHYKRYRIDIISVLGKHKPEIEHLKNISLN